MPLGTQALNCPLKRGKSNSTRADTPRPVVLRLNREINRALQAPEVRKPLLDAGHELASGTPEDLEKMIREELPRWAKVAREAKLSFD